MTLDEALQELAKAGADLALLEPAASSVEWAIWAAARYAILDVLHAQAAARTPRKAPKQVRKTRQKAR